MILRYELLNYVNFDNSRPECNYASLHLSFITFPLNVSNRIILIYPLPFDLRLNLKLLREPRNHHDTALSAVVRTVIPFLSVTLISFGRNSLVR